MKVIFLASGKSSRCAPLSDKSFFNFYGEPLILHLLKNIHEQGFDDFVIVANEGNEGRIRSLCQDPKNKFLKLAQVVIQKDLSAGQAGGVLAGLEVILDEESILISGGNDLINPQIYSEIKKLGSQNDGAILGKEMKQYFPGGYLSVDKKNKIKNIIEKPGVGNEPSKYVNIIAHFFQKSVTLKKALKNVSSKKDDQYEVALDSIFQEKNIFMVPYSDYWYAIKYPWHILEMMEFFLKKGTENLKIQEALNDFKVQENLNKIRTQEDLNNLKLPNFEKNLKKIAIHKTAQISETAVLKGENIVIEAGVKIFENAVIQGPVYLGKNVVVGNNALVRDSHIGTGSTVGYNTEVARSYLADSVSSHIAYIGDSIIDSGVNFGAYACTANLRLDKKPVKVKIKEERIDSGHQKLGAIVGPQVQIGIHAKLMPGVKVQKHIGPGELVK